MSVKIKKSDETPVCPYCRKELDVIHSVSAGGIINQIEVFTCPYCKAVLNVTKWNSL